MNFTEAMQFVHEKSTGPNMPKGYKARGVRRTSWPTLSIVFHDKTMFLGLQEFGFRWTKDIASESIAYQPTMQDILATDWEEFVW